MTAGTRRVGLPTPRSLIQPALVAVAILWTWAVHQGTGPDLGGPSSAWYVPRGAWHGLLAGWNADGPLSSSALMALPALALALAITAAGRSGVARMVAVSAVVACACFAFYGTSFSTPWRLFGWRWSGTLLLFSLVAGGTLASVWMTRSWRRLGWPLRLLVYAPVFAALVVFERNVTGTDPTLPFALSPWPAVQVLGLETLATGTAFVLLGVSEGLWSFSRLPASAGRYGAVAVGLGVAVAFPSLALGLASSQGLLPFQARPVLLGVLSVATLATLGAASLRLWAQPARLSQRSRLFGVSALALGAPLLVGQTLTRWDYAVTRNDRAERVITALQAHYESEESYPNDLEELVATKRLEKVPAPRIGFPPRAEKAFVYQNFGTSYLLEFSAPRWIQCAYNPPYEDEEDEELEEDGEEPLGGAWSCPSNPPELW